MQERSFAGFVVVAVSVCSLRCKCAGGFSQMVVSCMSVWKISFAFLKETVVFCWL